MTAVDMNDVASAEHRMAHAIYKNGHVTVRVCACVHTSLKYL